MSKIRFLTSSDEHLSDQNPGFRKDDYRASILKKLDFQGELAKKYQADAVLRGGDFFHHKAANRTTHNTIQQAARIHRSYGLPTYALAGNHDMSNNDPESVFAQQPLGVFFSTGVFTELDDVVIQKGSLRVRIVGVPYTVDLTVGMLQDKVKKKPGDEYVVAVVHALASMAPDAKTSEFFNEAVFDYRDLVFSGSPDAYVFGHYHKDQGIVDHMGVKFVNLGSISRGALTFENLERKPKVGLFNIDSSGLHVEEYELPCSDPSEIFDMERKNKIIKEKKDIQEFIDRLKEDASNKTTSDIRGTLATFPDDVKMKAMEILEAAEAGVMDE